MRVPGSNILNKALRVLTAQTITYLAFVSRSTLPNGVLLPVYAPAKQLRGSIQPVAARTDGDAGPGFPASLREYLRFQ